MATSEGRLRRELTLDDLHLTGEGYRAWVTVLEPLVTDICGPATG